jgi:hypothetical protein
MVAAALWAGPVIAKVEPPLDHDWYTVEVLIFEHAATTEVPSEMSSGVSEEVLSTNARRAYPANLLALILVDIANPGGGFAPLSATAEPWPEPPPPAEEAWFDEVDVDPEALSADPIEDEPETPEEQPADPAASEQPIELTEPPPTPRQLLEQASADALAEYQSALAADAYRWRSDPTQLALSTQAAALTRHGVGRILAHGAWLQPVPARDYPQPILIQSNEAIADRWRIEGTLAITLGRYLHVAAKLWYQPDPSPIQVALPSGSPGGWFSLTDDTSQHAPVLAGIPFDFDDAVDPELPYQVLSELRRMRSGELHYLDHPSFGMLIRVDPVEPPAELVELFEQLEEGVE